MQRLFGILCLPLSLCSSPTCTISVSLKIINLKKFIKKSVNVILQVTKLEKKNHTIVLIDVENTFLIKSNTQFDKNSQEIRNKGEHSQLGIKKKKDKHYKTP